MPYQRGRQPLEQWLGHQVCISKEKNNFPDLLQSSQLLCLCISHTFCGGQPNTTSSIGKYIKAWAGPMSKSTSCNLKSCTSPLRRKWVFVRLQLVQSKAHTDYTWAEKSRLSLSPRKWLPVAAVKPHSPPLLTILVSAFNVLSLCVFKNISTFLPCHLATRSSLANTCNWPYWDEPGARCPVRKDLPQRWPAGRSKGGITLQQELELRVGANAGCCCLLFEKKMGMVNGWTRTTKSQLRN